MALSRVKKNLNFPVPNKSAQQQEDPLESLANVICPKKKAKSN